MFNVNELTVMRQGLETVTIKGSEAKLLAALQTKVETLITDLTKGPSLQTEGKKPTRGRKPSN
tara:strand:- start:286 stop:474 length:189 start_codon:yes stop_codon:yes gene_type:complete